MSITIVSAGDKMTDSSTASDADFNISTSPDGGDSDAPEATQPEAPQPEDAKLAGPVRFVMRPDELHLLIDLMKRYQLTGQVSFMSTAARRAFEKLRNPINIEQGSLQEMYHELHFRLNNDFDIFVRDVVKPVRQEIQD